MKYLKYARILLLSIPFLLLTACDDGDDDGIADVTLLSTGSSPAMEAYYDAIDAQNYNPEDPDAVPPVPEVLDSQSAMAKIKAFAQNSDINPPPTVQDFASVGLEIEEDTWLELLREVGGSGSENADTLAELQIAKSYAENPDPVAYSVDLNLLVDQVGEIELVYEDGQGDNDTLNPIIISSPANGTAKIEGNKLIYTPHVGYSGYDELTYAVNDGQETSAASTVPIYVGSVVASKVAYAPASAGKRHILWFNGTSEPFAVNQHLFDGFKRDQYTRFAGLGVSPLNGFYRFKRTAAAGIEINHSYKNTTIRQKIDKYITDRLNEGNIKQNITNADHLMIGGFSRGAAFFLPYFLDNIDTFLPNLNGQGKTLTIFAMDPVDGSSSSSDNTRASLISLGIRNKANLIAKLKAKGFDLRMIYISSGFDYRQKNFALDKTFYEQKGNSNFTHVFTAKMGLTHANMSSWNGKEAYGSKTLNTKDLYRNKLVYGRHYIGWRSRYKDSVYQDNNATQSFSTEFNPIDPDLNVTRKIFKAFSNTRINQHYYCRSTGGSQTCVGSKAPGSVGDVENKIRTIHATTEKHLGANAGSNGRGIAYPMFGALSHVYIGGNRNFRIRDHSRLNIQLNGKLDSVLPPYSYAE